MCKMEFTTLQKGRGTLYVHDNKLYARVRTVGAVKYLKCTAAGCDGSAKLVDGEFFCGVNNVCVTLFFEVKE